MSDLYFTQATLVLTDAERRPERGATRPYVVHQLVADLFGDYGERPYLYRSEERRGSSQDVLVLSSDRPAEVDGVPGRSFGSVRSLRTKRFGLTVPPGTRLDFEIRMNATKDVPSDGKRSKRRDVWEAVWDANRKTDLAPHDVYGQYMRRKLGEAARITSARVTSRGFVRARRNLQHTRPITFVATNLIGTLEVRDSDGLERIAAGGIGRSKAFGCGLLCLSSTGSVLPRRYPEAAKELYA